MIKANSLFTWLASTLGLLHVLGQQHLAGFWLPENRLKALADACRCNCCGEQTSADCFCPNLDQCDGCNKSGRGIEQGLSIPNLCSPARTFWPGYRIDNEQSYFPMRQVKAVLLVAPVGGAPCPTL